MILNGVSENSTQNKTIFRTEISNDAGYILYMKKYILTLKGISSSQGTILVEHECNK